MFIEDKEYQAIQKIYEETAYSTPEEKIVIDALEEQNFTLEELEYIIENIDEVLSDTYITEGIEQEQLDEFAKAVVKAAVPLAKRMAQGFSKNVGKIPSKNLSLSGKVTKTVEKIKPFMSGAKQKLNSVVDKIKKPIMNNKAATGAVGALGAVGAATQLGAKKPTEINKINPKQFDNRRIKKIDPKQFDNRREPSLEPAAASTGVSDKTKQGKTRTKAQMMAAKRIASGKSIADVKKDNTDAMRARAKAKFDAFKAKRAEKKLDKQRDFDDPDKKMNRGESYIPDAYDVVLEYLLSTEQAATIEEANYIMTEMDAKTIQDIVS